MGEWIDAKFSPKGKIFEVIKLQQIFNNCAPLFPFQHVEITGYFDHKFKPTAYVRSLPVVGRVGLIAWGENHH